MESELDQLREEVAKLSERVDILEKPRVTKHIDLSGKIGQSYRVDWSDEKNAQYARDIIWDQEFSFGDALHLAYEHDLEMYRPDKWNMNREVSASFFGPHLIDEDGDFIVMDEDMQAKWKLREKK